MPDDRTVLDHLLEGRDALVLEVKRLSTAIDELDAVIGQIGGGHRRLASSQTLANGRVGNDDTPTSTAVDDTSEQVVEEPVNPPAEVEASRPARPRSRPRKAAARKSARKSTARAAEAPKSIRVHVLEMLAAEDREFGLAEIIDRIHDAGIQAHDDAVRSITIKLMKDGRVERVGRGQYKLARRGANAARHAAGDDASGNADATPAAESDSSDADAPSAPAAPPANPGSFTPPLNLGQPWDRG